MKKILVYIVLLGLTTASLANTLWWGTEPNTVSDQLGTLVPTSKTDGTVGAFAQLIWVGLDGNVDDFLYSGTGVSDDDSVIAITYSYGASGLGDKSGQFKILDSGLAENKQVYVRVYNAANPDYYTSGTSAVITGSSISYYWQSAVHSFTYSDVGANDEWNFTGGTNVQTTMAIPEPATFLLFGMGAMGAWLVRRKNRMSV